MTTWTVGRRTFRLERRPDRWQVVAVALATLFLAGTVVALARAGTGHRSTDTRSTDTRSSGAATTASKSVARSAGAAGASTGSEAATAASGGALATADSGAPTGLSVPTVQPKIVRTAELTVRVRGPFTAAVDDAGAVAAMLGGFVTSSSTSSLGRGRSSAELTVRVPADQFDEARRRLMALGKVESLEMSGRDVGGQVVDLDARLRAARAEEDALTALLAKAGDIGSILQVRDRLSAVRTEIEQLDAQQSALRDQVAMSTLRVSLREQGAPTATQGAGRGGRDASSISASVRTAFHAGEAVVGGMVIVLGTLLPLVVVALFGWLVVRFASRRRRGPSAEHVLE